jgi:hypothetical protein
MLSFSFRFKYFISIKYLGKNSGKKFLAFYLCGEKVNKKTLKE